VESIAINNGNIQRIIFSSLYKDDPSLKQLAIEALGCYSKVRAQEDLESVRHLLRRLFWMMNEESGNQMRNAPEAIGEILFNVPALIQEYEPILASFANEEPFKEGISWAMARIQERRIGDFV
jgi:hypothetical protein